jgi:hypothetical protein
MRPLLAFIGGSLLIDMVAGRANPACPGRRAGLLTLLEAAF